MRDLYSVASTFAQPQSKLRARLATVSSVEADRTITVTIGGDPTTVSGVKYLTSVAPKPGTPVWVLTDGVDLLAIGHVANANVTLAPRLYKATLQSIADATDVKLLLDTADSDGWSTLASNGFTAPVTGRYTATGVAAFAGNATGFRQLWIETGSGVVVGRTNVTTIGAGTPTWITVHASAFTLTKGDTLALWARQTSGGALNVNADNHSPSLTVMYLGA